MGIGSYLLHQFARPHGRLAGFVADLMNRGNSLINAGAIEALRLADGVRVLEVGFGGAAAVGALHRYPFEKLQYCTGTICCGPVTYFGLCTLP